MMDLEEIHQRLARRATKLIAGGFRPTNEPTESWIGKVSLFAENETIPRDSSGQQMLPLAQIHLPSLPFCPTTLSDIQLLTVFMSANWPDYLEPMGHNWLIREYDSITMLKQVAYDEPLSGLKPFPLRMELIEKDYPLWDDDSRVPSDVADAIIALEDNGEIEGYYDIIEHTYTHKIGGYPSFCQSGVNFGEGFEFALQISSDEKIDLNVVHGGSFMFARNSHTKQWSFYYDFL